MSENRVQGFRAAGVRAGVKASGAKDIAIVLSDTPCSAAGMFTTNRVKAAPVLHDQELLLHPDATFRAVIANAGNANAVTGAQGLADARAMAAETARAIGCAPEQVLVLSTGVIGRPMPMEKVLPGIRDAAAQAVPDGWDDVSQAMMTTDTRPKLVTRSNGAFTVTGVAKGAGMIAPNMATMLVIIATDAEVPAVLLDEALHLAGEPSFNRIVIDGDMSTNDTVLLLANGQSGFRVGVHNKAEFEAVLAEVCRELARAIARDGEGATRLVTIRVSGAASAADAEAAGRAISTSPLCKTAFYGADPNWGRILAAAGRSGAELDPDRAALWLCDAAGAPMFHLLDAGRPLPFDAKAASDLMRGEEWGFHLDIGIGAGDTTFWTCDLSHDYVSINADYTT
ncbi:MAG: bifunctional glutamate N-acetyltransferase/amino-acid acetyltransferase ArgJ [Anaerolineae bacterium]|nr:bifunctional glutamate N-acetyltransferase/amino-acid acetyltransferase ArgJ [Anaerolineae bacterium]